MGVPRLLATAAVACLCAVGFTATAASAAPLDSRSAADFRDSIGVGTHIVYFDTAYGDWPRVVAKLDELGVDHLRDGIYANPGWRDWNERYYRAVELAAAHGKKFAFGMGEPGSGSGSLDQLIAVAGGRLHQAAEAFEAPNEYDLFHGGPNWTTELRDYQRDLYAKVQASPALRGLPVIGPSLVHRDSREKLGSLENALDVGNLHPYTGGEAPTQDHVAKDAALAAVVSGRKPLYATEAGFHNALNAGSGQPPVSEQTGASYLLRTYLTHFKAGVRRTYAYELIDEKPEPALNDPEQHFGLLRNDFSEKPAFTALKNLLQLIGRPSPLSDPRAVDVGLAGDTQGVQHQLLQKTDRSYTLLLWQQASEWDTKLRVPLPGLTRRVSLALPGNARVEAARPVHTAALRSVPNEGGRVSLDVAADPLVVEIEFADVPAAAPSSPAAVGAPVAPPDAALPAKAPARTISCPGARAAGRSQPAASDVRIKARRSALRPLQIAFCASRGGRVEVRMSRPSSGSRRARVLATRTTSFAGGRRATIDVPWRRGARRANGGMRGTLRVSVRFRPAGGGNAVVVQRRVAASAVLPRR